MAFRFDLDKGFILANKYEIISQLGAGVEGEVYLTMERDTGIERAAKFFFPGKASQLDTVKRHAQKLYKIRNCPEIIQYHTLEKVRFKSQWITCLISEYVEGEILSKFLAKQRGQKMHYYTAMHLLYAITRGLQVIHALGEYHGDLHDGNIFVKPVGLGFQVKLIDVIDWRDSPSANIRKDVCDLIRIFYDLIGGQREYAKMPPQVKSICCGLKTSLIERKFRNAGILKTYLENVEW